MKDQGTVTLETGRLILRPLTPDDAPAMYRNWASDPEVTKYLTWPPHSDVDATRALLTQWASQYADPTFYQWCIVPKDLGEPIGSISVVHRDDNVESMEIGYCIGKAWWRRGITSEALAEVIRFFFEEVGVNRIESRHDLRNPNSGKVMAKCGMVCEGTSRQAGRNNQGLCDATRYGILRGEYFERKGREA